MCVNKHCGFKVRRDESGTTIVLCSCHLVSLPAVLEFLSSAPVCGDGLVGVWVDLASTWPVCQLQLQQCVTVSTQIPLCLALPPPCSIPKTGGDSMEAQSVDFLSSFTMCTAVFYLQPECQLNIFFSLEKKPPSSFCCCLSCPSSELVDFVPESEVLLPPSAEGSTPLTVP